MHRQLLVGFFALLSLAAVIGVPLVHLAQPKLVVAQETAAPTRPADGDASKIGKERVLYDSAVTNEKAVPKPEDGEKKAGPPETGESRVLRHVVLFKFKDTATEADIKSVTDAFSALREKIPTIQSFEWGTNVSIEDHAQGFTHCFIATFNSEQDRNDYLPHPDHQAFGKLLGPHLDKVLVVDFWAQP
jgi:hypothetical protein